MRVWSLEICICSLACFALLQTTWKEACNFDHFYMNDWTLMNFIHLYLQNCIWLGTISFHLYLFIQKAKWSFHWEVPQKIIVNQEKSTLKMRLITLMTCWNLKECQMDGLDWIWDISKRIELINERIIDLLKCYLYWSGLGWNELKTGS